MISYRIYKIHTITNTLRIQPAQFSSWLKIFFELELAAFDTGRSDTVATNAKDRRIEQLEAKIQREHAVLAELMEEHTLLKELGGKVDPIY